MLFQDQEIKDQVHARLHEVVGEEWYRLVPLTHPSSSKLFRKKQLTCSEIPYHWAKPYSTVLTPTNISLWEMFVQNVNYFVDCHRGIAQPDGTACMRVLKYPHLPSLAGNW